MRLHWLVMVIAVGLVAADQKADAPKDDNAKIVGTWKFVDGNRGGEKPPEEFLKSFKVTFTDKGKVIAAPDNKEGTFQLDSSKKPKTMEVNIDGKTHKGVYELDGDNLNVCIAEDGEETPTKFETKPCSKQMLMIFKREK